MYLNKKELRKIAREQGFVGDTLEKVYRLVDILEYINQNPLMKNKLALKGGTAINLMTFDLPRLSVDIDLDYSSDIDRDGMLKERKNISDDLTKYMHGQGYEVSDKTRSHHAMDSNVFAYNNLAGVKDNIKIEINYMMRTHVFPPECRKISTGFMEEQTKILTVTPIEIFASKIKALLDRAAARDLYDIYQMIQRNLFCSEEEKTLLRKCALFYMAVGNKQVPDKIDIDKIEDITYHKIRTDLLPVKRKNEVFELSEVKDIVKRYISELMQLSDNEKLFLNEFKKGNYDPQYLFEDKATVDRIVSHPMAIWKTSIH